MKDNVLPPAFSSAGWTGMFFCFTFRIFFLLLAVEYYLWSANVQKLLLKSFGFVGFLYLEVFDVFLEACAGGIVGVADEFSRVGIVFVVGVDLVEERLVGRGNHRVK